MTHRQTNFYALDSIDLPRAPYDIPAWSQIGAPLIVINANHQLPSYSKSIFIHFSSKSSFFPELIKLLASQIQFIKTLFNYFIKLYDIIFKYFQINFAWQPQ